jgi:hypothetical protein
MPDDEKPQMNEEKPESEAIDDAALEGVTGGWLSNTARVVDGCLW